jgi:hypothetical protein
MQADPAWPAMVLAAVQLADAGFCAACLGFVVRCLEDVGFPVRYLPLLAAVKVAAAVGLVAGLWVPYLGLAASAGLLVYFVLAIGSHLRKRDIGRNLMNATALLGFSTAVFVTFA